MDKRLPLFAAALFAAAPARAALMTFSSRPVFLGQTLNDTVITFEGSDTSAKSVGFTSLGQNLSLSGVAFYDKTNMYAVSTGFGAVNNNGNTYLAFDGTNSGLVTFPIGQTAVGFDLYSNTTPAPAVIQLNLSNGAIVQVTRTPGTPNGPATFLGFSESTPGITLTAVLFNLNDTPAGNRIPAVDNVTFGAAVIPTPEPSALGGLLAVVPLLRWRRKSKPRRGVNPNPVQRNYSPLH